ncbi:hypothetical protein [Nocardia asteroides]
MTDDPAPAPILTVPVPAVPTWTQEEADTLCAAVAAARRRAVGTLATAVDLVHREARERHGPWDRDPQGRFAYADQVLTGADDPARWDPQALERVRQCGAWLNRWPHPTDPPRPDTGPKPTRVALDGRARIAAVLRAWTAPSRRVPVADSLARIISAYADTTHGPGAWRHLADQWLPAESTRPSWGPDCHELLLAYSIHTPRAEDRPGDPA